MLKAILSFFAIVGLLISPVSAQAAQRDCASMMTEMMGAKAKPMDTMSSVNKTDCCDHKAPVKSPKQNACMNSCMAMCGVNIAIATPQPPLSALAVTLVTFVPLKQSLLTQDPPLLSRPPKSVA